MNVVAIVLPHKLQKTVRVPRHRSLISDNIRELPKTELQGSYDLDPRSL
jgi:hypothetical protein